MEIVQEKMKFFYGRDPDGIGYEAIMMGYVSGKGETPQAAMMDLSRKYADISKEAKERVKEMNKEKINE